MKDKINGLIKNVFDGLAISWKEGDYLAILAELLIAGAVAVVSMIVLAGLISAIGNQLKG